jgi:hypothetical protein
MALIIEGGLALFIPRMIPVRGKFHDACILADVTTGEVVTAMNPRDRLGQPHHLRRASRSCARGSSSHRPSASAPDRQPLWAERKRGWGGLFYPCLIPFFLVMILETVILIFFPEIALWLGSTKL